METGSVLQGIGTILGALIGAGLLAVAWRGAWIIRDIKATADQTHTTLTTFSERVLSMLNDHEGRLRDVEREQRIVVNHEVRRDPPERHR